LEAYQLEKLQNIINHAYKTVPYYKKLLAARNLHPSDFRNILDLRKIPITTKSDMREAYNSKEILAVTCKKYFPKVAQTSGSSGNPLEHLRDQNSIIISEALMMRYYNWMNVDFGHNQVLLWGRPAKKKWLKEKKKDISRIFAGVTEFNTHGWGNEDFYKCLKYIRSIRPDIIRGYSANLYLLARISAEYSIKDIKPKGISTTAQTLFDEQRSLMEKQFNCNVFDQYGGSETLISACQCDYHNGYHVMDEHVILELVDDPNLPDDIKKIVITDLDNWAQPFIRYENGDLAESANGERCGCGRELKKIKKIIGRTQDIIESENNRYFTLHPFTSLFYSFQGVEQFQIVQKSKKHIVVKIVKNNRLLEKDIKFVRNKLDKLLEGSFQYSIQYVNKIDESKIGKNKILISELSNQ